MRERVILWSFGGSLLAALCYLCITLISMCPFLHPDFVLEENMLVLLGLALCAQIVVSLGVMGRKLHRKHLAWLPWLWGVFCFCGFVWCTQKFPQAWSSLTLEHSVLLWSSILGSKISILLPLCAGAGCLVLLWGAVHGLSQANVDTASSMQPKVRWRDSVGPCLGLFGVSLWMFGGAMQLLAQFHLFVDRANTEKSKSLFLAKFSDVRVWLQHSEWLVLGGVVCVGIAFFLLSWQQRWKWVLVLPLWLLLALPAAHYHSMMRRASLALNIKGHRLATWPGLTLPKGIHSSRVLRTTELVPWTIWTPSLQRRWQVKFKAATIKSRPASAATDTKHIQSLKGLRIPCASRSTAKAGIETEVWRSAAFDRRLSWRTIRPRLKVWSKAGQCRLEVAVQAPHPRPSLWSSGPWWLWGFAKHKVTYLNVWHERLPKAWGQAKVLTLKARSTLLSLKAHQAWKDRLQRKIKSWLQQHPRSAAVLMLQGELTWEQVLTLSSDVQQVWENTEVSAMSARTRLQRGPMLLYLP